MRPMLASLGVLLFVPAVASAQTLSSIVGIFNIFIGIMLALSLIIYVAGMIIWVIRLGAWPSYRDEAIGLLKWPVAILFVVIILLAAVKLIQTHLEQAYMALGALIVIGVAGLVFKISSGGGGHGDEDAEH